MDESEGLLSPSNRKNLSTLKSSTKTLIWPCLHSRQLDLKLKSSVYPCFRRSFSVSVSVMYRVISKSHFERELMKTISLNMVFRQFKGTTCLLKLIAVPMSTIYNHSLHRLHIGLKRFPG